MKDQLERAVQRYKEVEQALADPNLLRDQKKYTALKRQYSSLGKIVNLYHAWRKEAKEIHDAQTILQDRTADPAFKELAKEELKLLSDNHKVMTEQLKILLLPKDPNQDKPVILEIRAGSGGQEAAIWAKDLFRMYQKLAEKKGWTCQVVDYTDSASGGYKEVIANISGEEVYGLLKYESGVHRVQRVPATETQGRIHTSAASVVVLPEVDELQITLHMKDIRKDTFCSSGPGGQSVNTTYSAIRLTHIPTGTVVTCQDEKSQLKNLDKAMKVLRARLYDQAQKEQQAAASDSRRSMIGSGDRSAKIRTYNYPQGRVTDHRIGYTQHNLQTVMEGAVDPFITALRIADETERLKLTA